MSAANTTGSPQFPQWGLSESYDQYGNRWSQAVTAGTGPMSSLSFGNPGGAQTNRPDGWCFDASGNLLAKSGACPPAYPNFGYDGENRMVGDPTANWTYVYDGNGTRVEKCTPNCSSPSSSVAYIFSGSREIAEYNNGAGAGSPSTEFIYSDAIPGAGLLASVSNGSITYFQSDHLGWRVATNASGQVAGSQGHFPFGESWYSSNGNEFAFTSYQRDSESGLDYAMARYYDSMAGRMCTADPVGGDPEDPQTWNRYAYARNDPIDITDASGKSWWSWLGDAVVGALAVILPEAYPALFSFMGQTTAGTATLDYTVTGGYVASASAPIEVVTEMSSGTLTATVTLTNVSTIDLGLLGGTAAKASLDSRNMDRFYKAQIKAEQDLKNGNCQQFLQQHGINPSDLNSTVQNEVPWNGLKSTISQYDAGVFDPLDPDNQSSRVIDFFKNTPVSAAFSNNSGEITEALAQNGGHDVYFRPGGRFGSGGITPGNIIHEGLHNLTAKGDSRVAQQLGLPKGLGSADINPALQAHHCFGD